jgi:hypothetical protein
MASSTPTPSLQVGGMPTPDIPITNPNNLVAVYSNNFGVSATMTDFTIYFLEVGQTPAGKSVVKKQEMKAIVTLPLVAAAGLQEVMQQVLRQASETMKRAQAQAKANAGAKK